MRKGILLAGGSGTRLHPMTLASSKQLLPVYDKPMVYYPLSVLMLAGIRDILVISTPDDLPQFRRLLGDGRAHRRALHLCRAAPKPEGLAQAFLIGRDWLAGRGLRARTRRQPHLRRPSLSALLRAAAARPGRRLGVRLPGARPRTLRRGDHGRTTAAPSRSSRSRPCRASNWAVIGLYFYDHRVGELAATVRPSARGELEITDLNKLYLAEGSLHVERLGRGCAWLDAGTPDSLLQAATFVQTIQSRQGMLVGSPEEVAFRMGWIDAEQAASPRAGAGQDRTRPGAGRGGGRRARREGRGAGDSRRSCC